MRRSDAAALLLITAAITLTGCSQTVHMEPAKYAEDVRCAEVSVRVPDTLAGERRRWTDAQATAAWGDPASVLLRCGVPLQGPSELPCYSLGGVDWLAFAQEGDVQRAITFGRDPAVEVAISRSRGLDFATVLEGVGRFVNPAIPDVTAECTLRATPPTG